MFSLAEANILENIIQLGGAKVTNESAFIWNWRSSWLIETVFPKVISLCSAFILLVTKNLSQLKKPRAFLSSSQIRNCNKSASLLLYMQWLK